MMSFDEFVRQVPPEEMERIYQRIEEEKAQRIKELEDTIDALRLIMTPERMTDDQLKQGIAFYSDSLETIRKSANLFTLSPGDKRYVQFREQILNKLRDEAGRRTEKAE